MTILDRIILDKKAEVGLKKKLLPEKTLEDFGLVSRQTRSLKNSKNRLLNSLEVI